MISRAQVLVRGALVASMLFHGCGGGSDGPPDAEDAGVDGALDAATDTSTGDATVPDGDVPDGDVPDGDVPDGAADGARPDGGPPVRCGDNEVEGDEECDDGNDSEDDLCLNDCTWACGDGVVNAVESCDTAIAAGDTGACPTACDDSMACTTDTLSGTECTAECIFGPITVDVDGDGCCVAGSTSFDDDDCAVMCGNDLVEAGETCDPVSSCPSTCDDANACTTDTSTGSASTCDLLCDNTTITACTGGDGCCPSSCTSASDSDCSVSCGNGLVEAGETCDLPSTCPTSCADGDVCTADVMTGSAANCNVVCSNPAITMCVDGDGCCAPGCNATNDDSCMAECGNGVPEPGEECDDGGTMSGDGCDDMCRNEAAPPTAFRITSLTMRDPHMFTRFFICADVTGQVNTAISDAVTMDDDGDGLLDLSILNVFSPLDQAAAMTPLDIVFADCTTPTAGCTPDGTAPIRSTANNQAAGICLEPVPGTTDWGPITNSTGPCYVSDTETLTLNLGGIDIVLQDAEVAGTYSGTPATRIVNGLIIGFLSEADAEATTLPDTLAVVGGMQLSAILPGGMGNCSRTDARDTLRGTQGWWFYLNFEADVVPYTP